MKKRWSFRAAAILFGLSAAILGAEVFLRFFPVDRPPLTRTVDSESPVLRHRPHQDLLHSRGWRFQLAQRYQTNNYGFVNDQDYRAHGPPVVAVVGDSYVEARMVPFSNSLTGRLRSQLEPAARVYSFAASGSPLSQYLVYADFARVEFSPIALIVVIAGNDFDESSLRFKSVAGYHYFDLGDLEDGKSDSVSDAELVLLNYRPSIRRRIVRSSALARYVFANSRALYRLATRGTAPPHATRDLDAERLAHSRLSIDVFLSRIEAASGLSRNQILFLVDATRDLDRLDSAADRPDDFVAAARDYFLERCRALGFEAIDLGPVFEQHLRQGGAPLQWEVDRHWNAIAHGLVARAASKSPVLDQVLSTPNQ